MLARVQKYRENKHNRVQLRFPAALYVNDRVVRDEFPDWQELVFPQQVKRTDYISHMNPRSKPIRGGVGLQSASQPVSSNISMTVKPSSASLSQPTQRDDLRTQNDAFAAPEDRLP